MSTQKREVARTFIEQYNVSAEEPNRVDIDKFFERLTAFGAVDDESYAFLRWEDLEDAGLPKLLARRVAQEVFRVFSPAFANAGVVQGNPKREVRSLSYRELLEQCNPIDPTCKLANRLDKLARSQPFIVYIANGTEVPLTVDVDKSLLLLEELIEGMEPRPHFISGGKPYRIYKLWDKVDKMVDEHPLYIGEPLRRGHSIAGLDWASVDFKTRQLLRLAVQDGVISKTVSEHDIFDLTEKSYDKLAVRFSAQALKLEDMIRTNTAPTLKIEATRRTAKPNNPFGGNKTF